MLLLPDNRLVLIGGGLALGAIALYLVANRGGQVGTALGRGAGQLAGGAATGLIFGIGDAVGLPDTTDPVTVSDGRAAFERGDYLEASRKLPAPEFLGRVGQGLRDFYGSLGIGLYNLTHANEGYPASAGTVATDYSELATRTAQTPAYTGVL